LSFFFFFSSSLRLLIFLLTVGTRPPTRLSLFVCSVNSAREQSQNYLHLLNATYASKPMTYNYCLFQHSFSKTFSYSIVPRCHTFTHAYALFVVASSNPSSSTSHCTLVCIFSLTRSREPLNEWRHCCSHSVTLHVICVYSVEGRVKRWAFYAQLTPGRYTHITQRVM
jgi:hypothetical protein